jgi:hypothetical protein
LLVGLHGTAAGRGNRGDAMLAAVGCCDLGSWRIIAVLGSSDFTGLGTGVVSRAHYSPARAAARAKGAAVGSSRATGWMCWGRRHILCHLIPTERRRLEVEITIRSEDCDPFDRDRTGEARTWL